MPLFLKNILSIIIPGALAFFISFLLNMYSDFYYYNAHYILLFFVSLSLIMNTAYTFNARSKAFTELLMAGLVIRLLIAFSVVAVYSVVDHRNMLSFAVHFIMYYVLFTIFEIRYLRHLIKTGQTNKHS